MILKLKKLKFTNFKGLRSLELNDFSDYSFLLGENGKGKTSVFDGVSWLLHGKNSHDEKDFNIKTFDADNNVLHKLNHEVEGEFDADGMKLLLRKVYKEKWQKKKGSEESEFTGHETLFFYNDVPLSQKEYTEKINNLLNEKAIKLVTNPLYFNQLKFQERRLILDGLSGGITDIDVANGNHEYLALLDELSGKSLIEYKKEIASKRKLLNDELVTIPTRIDEANRSMPEEPNYTEIESAIAKKKDEIKAIDDEMEGSTKKYSEELAKIRAKENELHELKSKLNSLIATRGSRKKEDIAKEESNIRLLNNSINDTKNTIAKIDSNIKNNDSSIISLNQKIESLESEKKVLVGKWEHENQRQYVESENIYQCPHCKLNYDLVDAVESHYQEVRSSFIASVDRGKDALIAEFNNVKNKNLADITSNGLAKKEAIDKASKEINDLTTDSNLQRLKKIDAENNLAQYETDLTILIQKLETIKSSPEDEKNTEELALEKQIAEFIVPAPPAQNNELLKQNKSLLQSEIESLNNKLATKESVSRIRIRIKELEDREKILAQEVANYDKKDFLISSFSKSKMEFIENKVNSMFQIVKFKMFETQINGGEQEICDCLVDGVPFSDLNTAKKINAGIDIINVLSEHFNLYAPIFIDNRESVNEVIPCKSQVINLKVSDTELKLVNY